MSRPPFAAAATAILITLAGGTIGLGEAHARAIYTGTFDPENALYKWSGTHAFSVDTACLASDGWKSVNGNNVGYNPYDYTYAYASCGDVELTGGSLTLKDKTADVERTIDFSTGFGEGAPPFSYGIWGIYVKGGQLAGVDTDPLGTLYFDALADEPLNQAYWYLRWESGKAPSEAYNSRSSYIDYLYAPSAVDPVYLTRCVNIVGSTDLECAPVTDEPARDVTFNRVPEPGSLALVAAALMAVGASVRRTRRA